MSPVIKWAGFILAFILAFCAFLWAKSRRTSRFQSRLTLLFFLFAIMPSAPLTLFLGQLLLKNAETFMLPGADESLNLSLEVVKNQLNERGQRFLRSLSSFSAMTPENLQASGFAYGGQITRPPLRLELRVTPDAPAVDPQRFLNEAADSTHLKEGELVAVDGGHFFESYLVKDTEILFVGFRAPDRVVEVKENVTGALQRYTTMLLLRERMVEQKLIWMILIIVLMFIAVLSVLLAGRVSAEVSTPLLKLTEGMKRVGEGDLNHRVEATAKDEIAYLIDSFNRMVSELRISRENLQRAERTAAWRDVARQISHEIKNPLTPIEIALYRLETTLPQELQSRDLREALAMIRSEIGSIRRIADTFSQFARMPHAELKTADVGETVRAAVELFNNNEAGVAIEFRSAADLPLIPMDVQQFRAVMSNLIKNAIEASERGRTAEVSVERGGEGAYGVVIRVKDRGCGMDEATLQRIFQPYFTTKTGGSGIGLFLASRIISDHGGTLTAESIPQQGSTFTISL